MSCGRSLPEVSRVVPHYLTRRKEGVQGPEDGGLYYGFPPEEGDGPVIKVRGLPHVEEGEDAGAAADGMSGPDSWREINMEGICITLFLHVDPWLCAGGCGLHAQGAPVKVHGRL